MISAGVAWPSGGGCSQRLKNWQREKLACGGLFSQIPCRRHDAARFFCLHRQCLWPFLLANGGVLIHTGGMLGPGSTRLYLCIRLRYSSGQDGVTAWRETERGDERLMSTSSVFNRPFFPGPMRPQPVSQRVPAESGRQSAHEHGRNLRQTVSSRTESLHSSHSKPPPGSRPRPVLHQALRARHVSWHLNPRYALLCACRAYLLRR